MKIGILADVHEHCDELRRALAVLKGHGANVLVFLGDLCEMLTGLEETVALLDDAGAVGVWGNHDFGLCADNPTAEDRSRYSKRLLDFMGRLRPRLEVDGCLFTHIEPWLDPEKIEDLWYLDGPPETPEQVARIFTAVPNRVMFVGHYHCWLLVSPEGVQPWAGEQPIVLDAESRHFVVVHAVSSGKCALFDTGTGELIPFDLGRGGFGVGVAGSASQ
jgi:predicted phosphodiesterase